MLEQWWLWAGFIGLILFVLWIDIKFIGGGCHKVSFKEAATWTIIWVSLALLFDAGLWVYFNHVADQHLATQKFTEFLSGYMLEKALSVDNVFVWLILFASLSIPAELQRKVLLWGVLGALVLRAVMVFGGSYLIEQFHEILYFFGAFLIFSGIKMLFYKDSGDGSDNKLLSWLGSHLRLTEDLEGDKFFIVRKGVRYFTPLFLSLMLVEISDIIFAVDSIPAVFSVTTDPFIVLTSNIFAIMGLRSMFFLLAGVADRFEYLKYGLAVILTFIGFKMLAMDYYHVSTSQTLGVIASVLVISMLLSWQKSKSV